MICPAEINTCLGISFVFQERLLSDDNNTVNVTLLSDTFTFLEQYKHSSGVQEIDNQCTTLKKRVRGT